MDYTLANFTWDLCVHVVDCERKNGVGWGGGANKRQGTRHLTLADLYRGNIIAATHCQQVHEV